MIEIELKSNVLLQESSFFELCKFLNKMSREFPNYDENDDVVAFIDSTSRYDYLVKIESNRTAWSWQDNAYVPTLGYVLVRLPLAQLISHIRPYQP